MHKECIAVDRRHSGYDSVSISWGSMGRTERGSAKIRVHIGDHVLGRLRLSDHEPAQEKDPCCVSHL